MEVLERRAFVGRAQESARLAASLDAVEAGHGRTVILGGEAGIGKTRLVEHFVDGAVAAGSAAFSGACLRVREAELPYAPFVEILRQLVRITPPERLSALLGTGRPEIVRLLPELGPTAVRGAPGATPERASQARLFEAVLGVIERLARSGTVVIVIEDIHWADRSTRDLLAFLVRSLRDARVLIILTGRSDEDESEADPGFLAELEREGGVERIELPPFGREEVAAQAAALLSTAADARVVDELIRRTDGNPFYVEELITAGAMGGSTVPALPPVLRDVLSARLRLVSPSCRDVLRAAAVAGRGIDDDLLATALAVPPRALASALREALESGIVVRSDGVGADESSQATSHRFRHELLREVVDADVFPTERLALHAAFAEALEARQATGRHVPAAEVAVHWDRAGRPERAFGPTVAAAGEAERVYAFAEALALWRRAALLGERLPDASVARSELLEHAAEAAVLAGEYETAVELGRAALDAEGSRPVGENGPDAARIAHLRERLRWFVWESGDRATAKVMVDEVLASLPVATPSVARSRALGQRAGIELLAARYEAARGDASDAVAIARQVGAIAEEAFALGVLGWCEAVLGDIPAGVQRFRDGAVLAEKLGSVEGMALGAANLVSLLDRVGLHHEALTAALEGYALTRRLGVARTYGGLLLGFAAKAQVVLGLWDDADRSTEEGLRLRPTGRAELWLAINRGRLLACRGDHVESAALLARARGIDDRLGGTEFRTPLLAALAELAVWSDRPRDARSVVLEGLAFDPGPILPDPGLAWLAALGLRALADEADAARAARDEQRLVEVDAASAPTLQAVERGATSLARSGIVDQRAAAIHGLVRAERLRLSGAPDPAEWSAVASKWRHLERPLHEAYARFREAEAILVARGSRDAAGEALREAHAIVVALGAIPLRRDIELLARQARLPLGSGMDAGDRPAGRAGSSRVPPRGEGDAAERYGFTDRELEVLRLVAGGWTNQQIGDALFITRKTASVHVSNILAKLAVDSRVEAAAIAHRIGLGADAPAPPDATFPDRPLA